MHFCADEGAMIMASIPFVGWYFRKFHAWYSDRFPKHRERCHAAGIELEETAPDTVPTQIPFRTTNDERSLVQGYVESLKGQCDDEFLDQVYDIAREDQGMFNLLEKLYHESSRTECDEIVKEMEATIRDYNFNHKKTDDKEERVCCGHGCCKD